MASVGVVGMGWVGSSVAISTLHRGIVSELLVNDVHVQLLFVALAEHLRADDQEACRCQFVDRIGGHVPVRSRNHFVASELLNDELVVWLVFIDGLYDIVTVAPRLGFLVIPFVPVRLREARTVLDRYVYSVEGAREVAATRGLVA